MILSPDTHNTASRLQNRKQRPPVKRAPLFALLAVLLVTLPALSTAPAFAADEHIANEVAVAKLWSRIRWVHPALTSDEIDWDAALVAALPKLNQATSPEALKAALADLMAPLHDQAGEIGDLKHAPKSLLIGGGKNELEWLPQDIALVHMHQRKQPATAQDNSELVNAIDAALPKVKAVVFDLRPANEGEGDASLDDSNSLLRKFIAIPVIEPATRYRFHAGYPPQDIDTSGGYYYGDMRVAEKRLTPAAQTHAVPLVFIVNQGSGIPLAALALQHAGLAWIVAAGKPSASWVQPVEQMPIAHGIDVQFSTGELSYANGSSGFHVDAIVSEETRTGPGSAALAAAMTLLQRHDKPSATPASQTAAGVPVRRHDGEQPGEAFPSLAMRQFAVIKLWSTMDAFFPYKNLMDHPWSDTLPTFLARMETVRNAEEYGLALTEMAAALQDSHVHVSSAAINRFRGRRSAGLYLSSVENKAVVSSYFLVEAAKTAIVKPGDVILRVDGEDVAHKIARMKPFIAASTPATLDRDAISALLNGEAGGKVELEVEDASGHHAVSLTRPLDYSQGWLTRRTGPVVSVLPGQIGYVDLDRLALQDVDAMFEAVKDTSALIFDMRGYPHGTAWAIAPRLNVRHARVGAQFLRHTVSGMPDAEGFVSLLEQPIPTTTKSLYRGKVVMLINEQTQSQAEHTGLFFEAAAPITFIGSPSAGTNGDITNLALPGDVSVTFTGQEVRHADGRQLQRIGLQPQIVVTPTVLGIRAGRDEVLERALAFLGEGK